MAELTEQAVSTDEPAPAWAQHADALEAFVGPFGDRAMDVLGPAPGQQLADVGCGPGTTTVELARRVAPDGSVTGVDVSARMLEAAASRAAAAGVGNVRFVVADAGAAPIGSVDGIYSRFGVMFFHEPSTAFEHLRRSIRPGGRFGAVVWAELESNPWMFVPTLHAAGPLHADLVLPGPDDPGPFSLGDRDRAVALLERCGFCDVDVVRVDHAWSFEAASSVDAIARLLSVGPLGGAWAEAADDDRAAAVAAVRAGCDDFRHGDGWDLPAAALVLSASVAG